MKTSALCLGLFLFLLLTPITAAQEPTTKENRMVQKQEMKEERKDGKDAIKELRQTKKEALKTKLRAFKDTVKAERVNRINTIFSTVNTNRTAVFSKQIETIQSLIKRLEEKLLQEKEKNIDISIAASDLEKAKIALAAAQTAVDAQNEKEYTIIISSENTVKTDIQTMRNILKTDLESTQQTIQTAKQALKAAIASTQQTMGEKNGQ